MIINCEQGTPEWFEARRGVVTASEFASVLSNGRGKAPSVTRRKYMLRLVGERITGEVAETYSNAHMERGNLMEPDARAAYEFESGNTVEQVGFVRNGDVGCSPDCFVGEDGLLEIKTKLPHIQIDVLLSGEVPPEHKPQIQGQLWVCDRKWLDFVSYWPGLPVFIKRVERDEEYIATLAAKVTDFLEEMQSVEDKIRGM